jgi:two-component system alkaline phosphatase synthesis response regulator PhoP
MRDKKILLIDDEPDVLKTSRLFLESEGFTVVTATDGMEALQKIRAEKLDLIIMDIMLPKLDGYKICRMLKFDDKYKRIPIILFTARAKESDEQTGKEVCADAYIRKPFDPQVLLGKIEELLK